MAQAFKGTDYSLDPNLPVSAILGYAMRRVIALLRCVLRGVAFMPSKLLFIGKGVELRNRQLIFFGKGVTLAKFVTIDGLSVEGVTLGDGVNIGPYSIIEATGVISSLGKGCVIGANSGMGAYSFIGAAGGVFIGEDVIMGQRVSFHSENHHFNDLNILIREQGVSRLGIYVGDNCWVGANVIFLDGAKVGSGCVVAAGAVVRGEFSDNTVIGGVPARALRTRDKEGVQ